MHLPHLQTRLHPKGRSNRRENGNQNLQDFTPDRIFVGFHDFKKVKGLKVKGESVKGIKVIGADVCVLRPYVYICKDTTRAERSEN